MGEAHESPALGPGREFDWIRSFLRDQPVPPRGVRIGPGDDGAVLDDGLVISTDLAVEGVHFRPEWISCEEAGYRAVAAGLSDLAAMAAAPLGVLLSVAAPGDGEGAGRLVDGARRILSERGIPLLGGDLTRSPGPLYLDVVSVGRSERPLLRGGASPGDELWVTGSLGAAAAAVALWQTGLPLPTAIREAFVSPRPRLDEARWLVESGARAGLDLSDGLAGDAGHLAAASGVAVLLEGEAVPVHPALEQVEWPREGQALQLALHGGEDFELLVAAPPGTLGPRAAAFRDRFGIGLTRVGSVESGEGVHLRLAGSGRRRLGSGGGFDHFGEGDAR